MSFNAMNLQRLLKKERIYSHKERASSYKHVIKRVYTYTEVVGYFLFISKIKVQSEKAMSTIRNFKANKACTCHPCWQYECVLFFFNLSTVWMNFDM